MFPSNRFRMIWYNGHIRNPFLKFRTKLGFYHVALTTPNICLEKFTITVVETQQLPDIEKIESKKDKFSD